MNHAARCLRPSSKDRDQRDNEQGDNSREGAEDYSRNGVALARKVWIGLAVAQAQDAEDNGSRPQKDGEAGDQREDAEVISEQGLRVLRRIILSIALGGCCG